MREINDAGLTLVKKWEGILDGDPTTVNLDPYLDPVGIWTIGWGHALRGASGSYLRGPQNAAAARALYPEGLTMTQAHALLVADLLDSATSVGRLVKVAVTDNAYAALVSFQFNTGALGQSSLLKRLNAGDHAAAADEFGKWVKARNPTSGALITLPGLVSRRAEERTLFLA